MPIALANLCNTNVPSLAGLRTFSAGKLLAEDAQADFLLLLSPGDKQSPATNASSVRFLSGSEKLRSVADKLRLLDYGPMFPGATPVKLLRRGTLSCSAATGDCSLVLLLPEDTHAVN